MRNQAITRILSQATSWLLSLLWVTSGACGKLGGKSKSSQDNQDPTSVTEDTGRGNPYQASQPHFQLKGAFLLSQSVGSSFGQGRDFITPSQRQGVENPLRAFQKISCFEWYSTNFGSETGLRFGEIYADSPSSSYFMALAICSQAVASSCLEDSQIAGSMCYCKTKESALAMLRRAVPFFDFSQGSGQVYVELVTQSCQKDPRRAIAAIMNSIAFVLRR